MRANNEKATKHRKPFIFFFECHVIHDFFSFHFFFIFVHFLLLLFEGKNFKQISFFMHHWDNQMKKKEKKIIFTKSWHHHESYKFHIILHLSSIRIFFKIGFSVLFLLGFHFLSSCFCYNVDVFHLLTCLYSESVDREATKKWKTTDLDRKYLKFILSIDFYFAFEVFFFSFSLILKHA